jgi:hypothetical protein
MKQIVTTNNAERTTNVEMHPEPIVGRMQGTTTYSKINSQMKRPNRRYTDGKKRYTQVIKRVAEKAQEWQAEEQTYPPYSEYEVKRTTRTITSKMRKRVNR